MPPILFSSLSSTQAAQAAAIFHDDVFGVDPALYAYEVDAATGALSGQRIPGQPVENKRPAHTCHSPPVFVSTCGPLILTDQAARMLARMVSASIASPVETLHTTSLPIQPDLLVHGRASASHRVAS